MFRNQDRQRLEETFLAAAQDGNFAVVKHCINKGVNVQSKGLNGMSALHFAVCNGHKGVVMFLTQECQANVTAMDSDGQSALHTACYFGYLTIAQYLVEKCNVYVESQDYEGSTALHCACAKGHVEVVKYLIQQCHANIDAVTHHGMTVYDKAATSRNKDLIEFLAAQQKQSTPLTSSATKSTSLSSSATKSTSLSSNATKSTSLSSSATISSSLSSSAPTNSATQKADPPVFHVSEGSSFSSQSSSSAVGNSFGSQEMNKSSHDEAKPSTRKGYIKNFVSHLSSSGTTNAAPSKNNSYNQSDHSSSYSYEGNTAKPPNVTSSMNNSFNQSDHSLSHSSERPTVKTPNVTSSTSNSLNQSAHSSLNQSAPSLKHTSERNTVKAERPKPDPALLNHPTVRLLQTAQWDNTVYSMSIARLAFGAATVKYSSPVPNDTSSNEVILIAGGRGTRKKGVNSGVLNSVEMFDPNSCPQAQICSHRLNTARYSCGSFPVTTNVMCIIGGKGPRNEYLGSAELVSTTSAKLLPAGTFSLPQPMASFGVAVVANNVFVFGGKTQDNTISTVYRADLMYFIEASQGKQFMPGHDNVWKQVGILGTKSGPAPRHSFAVVVDEEVCWIIGGFDGSQLLDTVGIYHTKLNRFILHPATLAIPRSGLTGFLLGRNVVVFGGIASASTTSYTNGSINYDTKVNVTAEVLVRDNENASKVKEAFVPIPNIDCPQKDQLVFRIGYRLFAIGQYNTMLQEPTGIVPCLNLVNLRKAFQMDQKVDGVVVPQPFPMPIVPMAPPEPKMSPDFDKLKQSIQEWKVQIEIKTQEYWHNAQEAETQSQTLHDELVSVWSQDITRIKENLKVAKPDVANLHDQKIVEDKIEALRLEFEKQSKKLNDDLETRIQNRKKEYELLLAQDTKQINNLETTIAEYGTQLQTHRDQIESKLSEWINKKNLDVTNMEGIISGSAPTAKAFNEEDQVNLVEDRKKIERVYKGLDAEPVMVSKEYGRQCTNNYNVKNQIGVGGFGAVYRGNDVSLRCTFAFKRVSMIADNPEKLEGVLKSFQREVSTLKRVRHPNIVALYGYHIKPNSDDSFLIYEFLDRGSLYGFLKTEEGRVRLPYLRRLRIMAESLRALNFLHTGGCAGLEIQHRDIKPHNICLAEDWSAKLIDCGLARIERIEEPSGDGSTTFFSSANGLAGTDGYICKAYWNGMRPYLSACDIYSFGVVMIELITGTLNRQNRQFPGDFFNHFVSSISGIPVENGLAKLMDRSDELVVWNEYDLPKLCKLALQCISLDVRQRPTAKTLAYELSMMLLRGEIGELPESLSRIELPKSPTAPSCSVCNEQRENFIVCGNNHILCDQCITQESIVKSNAGCETVECPILECRCNFNIRNDLYALVPQHVYNNATSEGRILECLERIERGQKRVISEISMVRKGVNRGLQAMASLTTSGNSPCPKLVWIIPGTAVKISAKNPRTWIKGFTDIPVKVYFLCEHSFRPVSQPVIITVKRKWLGRIAPALKITLFVLKLTTSIAGLPFPVVDVSNLSQQVEMAAEFVDSLLDTDQCSLINQAETLFTEGTQEFNNEQLKTLTGQAYDLLADGVRTGGQLRWKEELKPVMNANGATIWVKNEYVDRYSI